MKMKRVKKAGQENVQSPPGLVLVIYIQVHACTEWTISPKIARICRGGEVVCSAKVKFPSTDWAMNITGEPHGEGDFFRLNIFAGHQDERCARIHKSK